ncbi:DUF4554 domain-containing protein isoform X2 [Thalassophryne amazonica]|nr:DUF4554 domain-containing protein isoform X2 [Thalassophryne amazonica]
MESLQWDLKDRPSLTKARPGTEPDPEQLCAFTDLHGSLQFLLSFQKTDPRLFSPEVCPRLEAFLHNFSLANAGITIHFSVKLDDQIFQQVFRVKIQSKLVQTGQPPLSLDVACGTQPPLCVKKGEWCHGGHPILGERLLFSIPPAAMDQGLFGELSLQLVTLLKPCMLQYPNLATQLTRIQVLVYSPSNVPVKNPSVFLQQLPDHLDYQELGLRGLYCSSVKDAVHSGGTVYSVEQEHCEEPKGEQSLAPVQQDLVFFLFLQHSDPFTSELADMMATEEMIEHHLEDILRHNRQVMMAALQSELKHTLKAHSGRTKDQEKLHSAVEVILSSAISIVSCSSNLDFRGACLNSMKVCDTQELSASMRESLRRVTSWKFTPRSKCFSAVMDEHPVSSEATRTEI